jgi:hypothetical protein
MAASDIARLFLSNDTSSVPEADQVGRRRVIAVHSG